MLGGTPVLPARATPCRTGAGARRWQRHVGPRVHESHRATDGVVDGAGTVHAALTYFTTHRPDGLTADGSGSTGGPATSARRTSSTWGRPKSAYASPTVDVEVASFGSGVAVRVDTYAVWLPSRTSDSMLHDSTSVTVTLQAHSLIGSKRSTDVRKTLPAAAAERLGRLVDGSRRGRVHRAQLPGDVGRGRRHAGVPHCARRLHRARPGTNPCADTASLRTPAGRHYLLQRGTLHAAVLAALHLPAASVVTDAAGRGARSVGRSVAEAVLVVGGGVRLLGAGRARGAGG